jgi:anti-anti-sigma factor
MNIMMSEEQARVPITIFSIEGAIAAESYEQLQKEATDAYSAGTRYLLLDLGKVDFVSSSGLRAIHQIFLMLSVQGSEEEQKAVQEGVRKGTYKSPYLKLANASRDVQSVLKMAGFDMFLDIYSNRKEAIAAF